MKVDTNTKLKEIFDIPGMSEVLLSHGFPCVTCPMARMELDILDIGSVCSMYGIDEISLLKDINDFLENKKK